MRRRRLLRSAVAALAIVLAAPAVGQGATDAALVRSISIAPFVAEASLRFGLPSEWIYAVIRAESAGRVHAVSTAGAMGLMQLMPGTWARQRTRFALGTDPFDPRDNILAGTSYLREMHDRYGAAGFLAAYNAGPGRYEEWRDRGRTLPAETRAYVAKLALTLQPDSSSSGIARTVALQRAGVSWTRGALFPARRRHMDGRPASTAAVATPARTPALAAAEVGLFVPLSEGWPR